MFRPLIIFLTLALGLIAAQTRAQSIAELSRGRPYTIFHGEFSAADATDATLTMESQHRFTLYADSSTTALTLAADDVVIVTDVQFSAPATTTFLNLYDGADNTIDAGEAIVKQTRTIFGVVPITRGHWSQAGTYPKLKASAAGQIDAVIRGIIVKKP